MERALAIGFYRLCNRHAPSANAVRADFVPLIAHDHLAADGNATQSSRTAIWLIAVVWSIAGALCLCCWRQSTAAGRRFGLRNSRLLFWFAVICLFAASWELSMAET